MTKVGQERLNKIIAKLNLNSNFNFSLSFELSLALLSYFPTTHPPSHWTGILNGTGKNIPSPLELGREKSVYM